ncbi:hypothetical protein HCU65_00910 [Bacillus atrophaeus]|nr:hypothetical protein HCU65_00910 [Bacillus atrophaeus]
MDKQLSKTHILRHVMTHKIHHIGQLSVWTRELGIPPVAANFFNRTILLPPQKTASNKRMLLVSHFNASCH